MATVAPTGSYLCEKWADCSCAKSGTACGCGSACACGSVSVQDVEAAKATGCPFADCRCGGPSCSCGKNCKCGGTVQRSLNDWVQFAKTTDKRCNCGPAGQCSCGDSCACGGNC
jgi:hypothetical protein